MKPLVAFLLFTTCLGAAPHATSSRGSDGSLIIDYFTDVIAPLRFTVIAEGWSFDDHRGWTLEHTGIVSHGIYAEPQKAGHGRIGGTKFAASTVTALTPRFSRVSYKVLLEWQKGPAVEWVNPESFVLNIKINEN